jgi:hypothetical protein
MDLWRHGTRLRGAVLHPCHINDSGRCGPLISKNDVDSLRAQGANLINASYPGLYTESPPYRLNPQHQAYLDNLVSWAEQAGMFVVIHFRSGPGRLEQDIHVSEDGPVWTDSRAQEAWAGMWRYTAERYRDRDVVVGYHLMAEPHVNINVNPSAEPASFRTRVAGTLQDWNALASKIVSAIRSVDTNTPVIINSLDWAHPAWFRALDPVDDRRVVYAPHFYQPNLYAGAEDPLSYPSEVTCEGERFTFDRQWLLDALEPVIAFQRTHKVPIYVSEVGSFRWRPGAVSYQRDLADIFESLGWNYTVYAWRGDEASGFDGYNLEYGTDRDTHRRVPGNPLLAIHRERWSRNVDFPP